MDTKLCNNCKREVAASNFSLHEAHCCRFLSACPLCNESVPTEEMKEHQEKEHSQVRCKLCSEFVENCKMGDHETDECKERQMKCEFCELNLPFSALLEHSKACGSRTEFCNDCNKYIRLSDLENHKNTCSSDYRITKGSKKVVPCQFCKKSYAEDQLLQHQDVCNPLLQYVRNSHSNPNCNLIKTVQSSAMPSEIPFSFHSVDKGTWEQYHDPKTSEVSEFSFSSRNSEIRKFYFSSGISLNPSLTAEESGVTSHRSEKEKQLFSAFSSRRVPQTEKEPNDEFGVCSQCNIMLPSPTLKEHEKKCRSLAALQNSIIKVVKVETKALEGDRPLERAPVSHNRGMENATPASMNDLFSGNQRNQRGMRVASSFQTDISITPANFRNNMGFSSPEYDLGNLDVCEQNRNFSDEGGNQQQLNEDN